jgi:hypothetical protein
MPTLELLPNDDKKNEEVGERNDTHKANEKCLKFVVALRNSWIVTILVVVPL